MAGKFLREHKNLPATFVGFRPSLYLCERFSFGYSPFASEWNSIRA